MALTVADIMDTDTPTVTPEDTVERVLRVMRDTELSGVPVVTAGGRCVGIITEADLVMTGEDADLHLPHYFELFGGFVFLEPLGHFEERLRKATAALARDLMTEDPVTIEPSATVQEAARLISRSKHNRLPVDRARAPGRRGHPRRRARGADARVAVRALARIDLAAIERNCARLARVAAPARAVRGRQGGRLRPRRACPPRARRRPAGAAWLAVATAQEAAELRAAGIDGPLLVMGALSAAELTVALRARADVVAWREGFVAAVAAHPDADGAGVHVKLDTGMGRLGTRDAGEATRTAAAVAAAPRLRLAGAMTHFATADDDPGFAREQLARFLPWAKALRAAHGDLLLHAANSAATLGDPGVAAGHGALRHRRLRHGPVRRGPRAPRARRRRWSCAPTSPRSSRSRSARASATAGASSPREPTWIGTIPIGYGDGVRRALTNDCDVLVGGRRVPLVGTVSMDNITVDLGPRAAGARRRGGPDRRAGATSGCSPRSGRGGSARSTTRSRAGSARASRASTTATAVERGGAARRHDRRRAPLEAAREILAGRRGVDRRRRRARPAARPRDDRPRSRGRRRPAGGGARARARDRRRAVPALGRVRRLARRRAGPRAGTSTSWSCATATSAPTSARGTSPSTRWRSRLRAASCSTRTAGAPTSRRGGCGWSRRTRSPTIRCARCARCGSRSSSSSRSSPTQPPRSAARRRGSSASPPSASSASSST